MGIFLLWLCVVCVPLIHSIFDGACPRKDPPPGVLVLSPGSSLVLSCWGHVKVNGVKVSLSRNSSANRSRSSLGVIPTPPKYTGDGAVSLETDKSPQKNTASEGHQSDLIDEGVTTKQVLGYTDKQYTASPHMVQPTSASRPLKGESDWEAEEMDIESEDEEGKEGRRVTRGIKLRPQWKWNQRTVVTGDRDLGELTFGRSGALLSLASVRLTDSGKYTCHHRGRKTFAVKVIVADRPESPHLFCYKKSPSSKIRCEWTAQKPVIKQPDCYLSLSKSPTEEFHKVPCSYSSQHSRCWCALDYNEDELRTLHMAYLCVTSITSNATSSLLRFTPLSILKPDPPSNVSVQKEEGQETRMQVTWNLPTSWKQQDNFYELIYEIKYRPCNSSLSNEQIRMIKGQRSYTITDALPGVVYKILLRTKEEYDGQSGDWSTPVYARSWTDAVIDDLSHIIFDLSDQDFPGSGEGSGADNDADDRGIEGEVSHLVLWISGLFALLSVILAAYIFRHKDRFMSKLQSFSVITQRGDLSQPPPSAPTAPEGQAMVTFAPPQCKHCLPREAEEEEENEEEQIPEERIETMHFNNTSYFFLQRE
ncbi:interleukin-6 receptor subunit alpha [Embiotoca jacksoni]|uniref:interleukin-6 receptor subunit alpha n=1 Tax=Embiotoca jacksoni TaxID=100190 RepID=UPI0037049A5B